MPQKFAVETEGPFVIHGVCMTIDPYTGKGLDIERIRVIDEELVVPGGDSQ